MSSAHPVDWYDLCSSAFHEELAAEQGPLLDSPVLLPPAGERRPATNSTPTAMGACGPAELDVVSPDLSPRPGVDQGSADASATPRGRGANLPPIRACICGATVTPSRPYGDCHGGRACLDRFLANGGG